MRYRVPLRAAFVLGLFPLLALAVSADFSFTTQSLVGGNEGAAMNLMQGGTPGGLLTSVCIHGGLVRTDSGGVIRILDFSKNLAIQIMPGTRTYTVMTFAEMDKILTGSNPWFSPSGPSPDASHNQMADRVQERLSLLLNLLCRPAAARWTPPRASNDRYSAS